MKKLDKEKRKVSVGIRMYRELIYRLNRVAEKTGISKNKIIEQGTHKRLREIEKTINQ